MKQINTQKMSQKEREDAVNEVRSVSLCACVVARPSGLFMPPLPPRVPASRPSSPAWERLQIRILASVESQYIIKFNEAFVDNMNLYIITEYAGKGDMFQRLRRLAQKRQMMPEDQVWVFFIQLCLGIKALHDHNILHRCATYC